MLVRDVMKAKSGGVILIRTDATVAEAVALLVAHNIGSLPVVNSQSELIGIFSERDVLKGVKADCTHFVSLTMVQVMTPEPITCTPSDNLHEVMGKMTAHKVGQLPIVSGTEVVGIISVGDVIKSLYEQVDTENRHLFSYLYGWL